MQSLIITIVDGTIYFDREKDEQMQKHIDAKETGW